MSTLGFTNVYNIGGFNANPGLREIFPTEGVPEIEQARLRLRALIETDIGDEIYTDTSFAAFQTALEAALLAVDSDDIDVIIAAYNALESAIAGLVLFDDLESALQTLQELIDYVEGLNGADFTPATWANLQSALEAATEALESEDIDDINEAIERLQAAIDGLIETESPTVEPPTAEPPTAEPPTAEPPTTKPPTAEPPTTKPPATHPPTQPPAGTKPPVANRPTLPQTGVAALPFVLLGGSMIGSGIVFAKKKNKKD